MASKIVMYTLHTWQIINQLQILALVAPLDSIQATVVAYNSDTNKIGIV